MTVGTKDDALLKEISDNFDYSVAQFEEIRREGRLDMQYIAGDPWDPKERKEREANGRPCLNLDELNQYVNQQINNLRMNKRSIKVLPRGNGATDKTAEFHASLIRGIEYKSKAQSAYISGFESALQRSYGWFRISKQYINERSFEQELAIRRIPNPDVIYPDPDCKEVDFSDMKWCFAIDQIPKRQFLMRWPKAEIKDFSTELMVSHPAWIKEKSIQVAEYWKVKLNPRILYQVATGQSFYADDLPKEARLEKAPDGSKVLVIGEQAVPIVNERKSERRQVIQYWTNGIEILEEKPWDGRYIPFVPVIGKEIWLDNGAGAKRMWFSLVRLARDPQKLYAYAKTCEAESLGQVPKTPWIGYEGQFEGHEAEWAMANKKPIPFLQAKAITEPTGGQLLPLPTRQLWEPPIQSYEMASETARRAIQSALGMYNSSVGKHDTNVKSGKAIEALDQQSDQGNYHFIDNFDRALEHAGRILDDMIEKTYDTPRDVGIQQPDDSYKTVRINEPVKEKGQVVEYRTDQGEHDVTISTGPSFESQREEVQATADLLLENELFAPRIGWLAVKMKNLGPLGDKISDLIKPPDVDPEGNAPIPPQLKQQMDAAQKLIDMLTEQLNAAKDELQMREGEQQTKLEIARMQEETKRIIAMAQIDSKEGIVELQERIKAIQVQLEAQQTERAQDQADRQQDLAERQATMEAQQAQKTQAEAAPAQ